MMLWQRILQDLPRNTGEGTGTGTGTGDGGGTKPWYDGNASVTPEVLGHWQNRGLHDKTPAEVAIAMTAAHREAEKHLGVPAAELMRLPKDPNSADWNGVWERLGRPKEAKDYDFTAVKTKAGEALPKDLEDFVRNTAFTTNMTRDAALRFAQETVKRMEGQSEAEAAVYTDKITAEKTKLQDNWKNNFEANMVIAKAGAAKLGISPEAVDALEKVVGYAATMDALLKVGMSTQEAGFITNNNPNLNGGLMTKDQAAAKKAELQNDSAWVQRWLNGGQAEARELAAITRILAA